MLMFQTLHPGLEGCRSCQQSQRICLVVNKRKSLSVLYCKGSGVRHNKEYDISVVERMLTLTKGNHSFSTGIVHLLVVDTPGSKFTCCRPHPTEQPTWRSSPASRRGGPCCRSAPWSCARRSRKSCPSGGSRLEPDQKSVSVWRCLQSWH